MNPAPSLYSENIFIKLELMIVIEEGGRLKKGEGAG
jgi:hypothetical protein